MTDSERIDRARADLSRRLEQAKTVFPMLKELSDTGGKTAVKRYFSDRFGEVPNEQQNELIFRYWILRFDSDEKLLGMTSNSEPARAVEGR